MFKFVSDGVDAWKIIDIDLNQLLDKLPVATYSVGFNGLQNYFFLQKIDDFTLPSKMYGEEIERADRILETFLDRPAGTGVVLAGEKGSGKTLCAKKVSKLGLEKGIPTLVVNQAYCGEIFNQFVQSIKQPAIMIFDEFEKVYDSKSQEAMLTLLDGTMGSKKLYMVTINDVYKIDDFMKNRPGRFFYMFRYGGITEEVIRAYCADVLKNKSETDAVVSYSYLFNAFTFDMLVAIVEEMNRYDEKLSQVVELVNANHEFDGGISFEIIAAILKGKTVDEDDEEVEGDPSKNVLLKQSYVYGEINPLNDDFAAYIYFETVLTAPDGSLVPRTSYNEVSFTSDDLKSSSKGSFTFENDKARITIRRKVTKMRRFLG